MNDGAGFGPPTWSNTPPTESGVGGPGQRTGAGGPQGVCTGDVHKGKEKGKRIGGIPAPLRRVYAIGRQPDTGADRQQSPGEGGACVIAANLTSGTPLPQQTQEEEVALPLPLQLNAEQPPPDAEQVDLEQLEADYAYVTKPSLRRAPAAHRAVTQRGPGGSRRSDPATNTQGAAGGGTSTSAATAEMDRGLKSTEADAIIISHRDDPDFDRPAVDDFNGGEGWLGSPEWGEIDIDPRTDEKVTPVFIKGGPGYTIDQVERAFTAAGIEIEAPFQAGSIPPDRLLIHANVGGRPPVYLRQRPMPPDKADILDKLLEEFIKTGVIEPASSVWNSPCILVKKASSDPTAPPKWRLCVDLRAVNALCERVIHDAEPISEALRRAAGPAGSTGKRLYAKFDLTNYFYQALVDEASRDIFAFTDARGKQWRFRGAPMGWVNTPALTGQFLSHLLRPQQAWTAICVDDILIWADSQKELDARIDMLLRALKSCNLQLRRDKVVMGVETITFAGYQVSLGAISIAPDKIAAIQQWPVPDTRVKLREFLGFATWLSDHVPRFEAEIRSLRDALAAAEAARRTRIKLTESEVRAFRHICNQLTSGEALGIFTQYSPLDVCMDASKTSGGSVLLQDGKPLAYHSFSMNTHEQLYPVREKEMLSLVKAARRYYHWFLLAPVVNVFSDHQSLETIPYRSKTQGDRVHRWAAQLAPFKLRFQYVPGDKLAGPDGLSRSIKLRGRSVLARIRRQTGHLDKVAPSPLPPAWSAALPLQYDQDPFFFEVLPLLRGHKRPNEVSSEARSRAKTLTRTADGLVWNTTSDFGAYRLALPLGSVRDAVLQDLHSGLSHPTSRKFTQIVSTRYYIPGLSAIAEKMSRTCIPCAQSRHSTVSPGYSASYDRPQYPFHTVSMDVATGFPTEREHDAVLVVMCELTKLAQLIPFSTRADTADLIRVVESRVIAHYGMPKVVSSDSGSIFTSTSFKKFLAENAATPQPATPGHHRATVERVIGEMRTLLRALVPHRDGHGWSDVLWRAEYAINRMPSRADARSAFERYRGYNPPMPLLPYVDVSEDIASPEQLNLFYRSTIDDFHANKESVASLTDKGHTASAIAVGSWVAVPAELAHTANTKYEGNRAAKLRPVYIAGFKVIEKVDEHGNWKLAMPASVRTAHIFHERALKVMGSGNDMVAPSTLKARKPLLHTDGSPRARQIQGSRTSGKGRREYLVAFQGQFDCEAHWLPQSGLHARDQHLCTEYDAWDKSTTAPAASLSTGFNMTSGV